MSDEAHLIGKHAVAAMLGVTVRQVERHTSDPENPLPIAERAPRGSRKGHRYDIREVHEWAIARMIDGDGEVLDLGQERARLARTQRERQQLQLTRERGELVPVEAIGEVVGDDYTRVRARLLSLPVKAAPLLTQETDTAVCQQLLDDLVREALTELSDPETIHEEAA